jgi:hypothetical protein
VAVRSEGGKVVVDGGGALRGRRGQGQQWQCAPREVESRSTAAA